MPSTERREVSKHPSRAPVLQVSRVQWVLGRLGADALLLLAAVSICIGGMLAWDAEGSAWVRGLALLVALTGIPMLVFGWWRLVAACRPGEPVEEDEPEASPHDTQSIEGSRWEASGVDSDLDRELPAALGLLVAGPVVIWLAFSDLSPTYRRWGSLGLGCALLLVVIFLLAGLPRLLRFGRSRLRFERFPFVLGEPVQVVLERFPRLRRALRLKVALRCYEEVALKEKQSRPRGRTRTFVLYEDLWVYDSAAEALAASGSPPGSTAPDRREWALEFPLPDEPRWSTRLGAVPCRYWELEVTAAMPWIDYRAVFPLPIYGARGAHDLWRPVPPRCP